MRLTAICLMGVAAAIGSVSTNLHAEMLEKTGTFGGLKVTYKVVHPAGYDAAKPHPVVLVFTGGPQTLQIATSTVESDWQKEAERRGYVVIAPASPNGELFFEGADRIFPEFLDFILKTYKVEGKLHIAGHSNGGLSAFHIAAKYPQYFSTLTGYPGLLDGPDRGKAAAIKPMCIFMHVGDLDDGWKDAMRSEATQLKNQGYKIQFAIEPKQVHRLKASEINLSVRLFDEIESCK
jgi:poly(3-hydroxybutyrate) depolymerase